MFASVAQRFRFSGVPNLTAPQQKVILPSLLFDKFISIISSLPLPCRRRSLKTPTFLFLALLCSFCQLDTATPFGSRLIHSFDCPSFNTTTFAISTTTFSATADSDTTPSLLCSGPASYLLASLVELLAAPFGSSQPYIHSNPSLSNATFQAQRFSPS